MRLARLIEYLRNHLRLLIKLSLVVLALSDRSGCHPAIVHKEHHAHTALEAAGVSAPCSASSRACLIVLVSKWYHVES